MKKSEELTVGVDYVICQICNFRAQNLGIHLARIHHIESAIYIEQYTGLVMTSNSQQKYAKSASENSWLTRAISEGQDLTKYWEKVGKGVSEAIMASSAERERRSHMMIALNNKQQSDPIFQRLVSETAQKTSARPDVQIVRSRQLKNWRDNNPEAFYEQCVKKMITTFQSKPEKKLFMFVSGLDGFTFKKNQFINSHLISNKSHNKQMDIGDKEKRVYIEFDGVLHFRPKHGNETLARIKQKDIEIERHIINHNWTLIRVSYDQYVDKNKIEKSFFKLECLSRLIEILKDNHPGVYKIGEAYGQH